jgi:hypothetical protein
MRKHRGLPQRDGDEKQFDMRSGALLSCGVVTLWSRRGGGVITPWSLGGHAVTTPWSRCVPGSAGRTPWRTSARHRREVVQARQEVPRSHSTGSRSSGVRRSRATRSFALNRACSRCSGLHCVIRSWLCAAAMVKPSASAMRAQSHGFRCPSSLPRSFWVSPTNRRGCDLSTSQIEITLPSDHYFVCAETPNPSRTG